MANDMNFSQVQELVGEVEYLVYHLKELQKELPDGERLIKRLENASAKIDYSIKHGLYEIQGVLLNLDYANIDKRVEHLLQNQLDRVVGMMDHVNKKLVKVKETNAQTDKAIAKTSQLLNQVDRSIDSLAHDLQDIPKINRKLLMAAGAGGFVSGIMFLYLLSYLMWLPHPYFLTKEQSILLEMVRNESLHLDGDTSNTLKVRLDYKTPDAFSNETVTIGAAQ